MLAGLLFGGTVIEGYNVIIPPTARSGIAITSVILGLIEVAIIWTIIARYLPVADMGTLIQNMLQRKPLLVTG